jgi:hypothetical protein
MAIINSYPTVTPTEGDLVLISDVSEDGNPTRTATVSSLGLLSQSGGLVGPTGPQGNAGVAGATGAPGTNGANGANGTAGTQGVAGADGTSITILGEVADCTGLPNAGANTNGDLYILDADDAACSYGPGLAGDGYVWDGTAWLNIGPLRGPQGIQGVTGTDGADGAAGTNGNDGVQGAQGIQGAQGTQGTPGVNPTGAVLNTTDGFAPPIVSYIVSLSQIDYNGLVSSPPLTFAKTLYVII